MLLHYDTEVVLHGHILPVVSMMSRCLCWVGC